MVTQICQYKPVPRIAKTIIRVVTLLFIMLWVYSAVSKLLDYDTSMLQMRQSPFISDFANILVWAVPLVEIFAAILLIIERTRRAGLYCSLFLITMFAAYIYAMLHMSYHVPCSCGGALNNLSWEEHFVFNMGFVVLGILAILFTRISFIRLKYDSTSNQAAIFNRDP